MRGGLHLAVPSSLGDLNSQPYGNEAFVLPLCCNRSSPHFESYLIKFGIKIRDVIKNKLADPNGLNWLYNRDPSKKI